MGLAMTKRKAVTKQMAGRYRRATKSEKGMGDPERAARKAPRPPSWARRSRPSNVTGSSSSPSTSGPSCCRSPPPRSIERWHPSASACRCGAAQEPNQDRSSSARSPSGPSPSGTTVARGSARSTSQPTTEARGSGSSARPSTLCAWPLDGGDAGAPGQGPAVGARGPAGHPRVSSVPAARARLRQRRRVHHVELFRYCEQEGITFTRSRPYRKNDNCFVEQKNWPVVRQQVGYHRYDTSAELDALRDLYRYLRLYVNFFQPQMKLVSKSRRGGKVSKTFDTAQTHSSGSWPRHTSQTTRSKPSATPSSHSIPPSSSETSSLGRTLSSSLSTTNPRSERRCPARPPLPGAILPEASFEDICGEATNARFEDTLT